MGPVHEPSPSKVRGKTHNTCSLFLLAPSTDKYLCKGCDMHVIADNAPTRPERPQISMQVWGGVNSATVFKFSLLGLTPSLEMWWARYLISSQKNSHLVGFSFRLCSQKWSNTTSMCLHMLFFHLQEDYHII